MSDLPIKTNPADLGGEEAGPIDTTDHGMKFWEKQANGLRMTMVRNKLCVLDELRRAAEDLGDEYYKLAYFERTSKAMRNLCLEKGYFTEEELRARMDDVRARFDVPDEMDSRVKQEALKAQAEHRKAKGKGKG